jgi:GT2 family glycosyltransferase
VELVGLFDENIYPAYLEDCDWSYRADLLKVKRYTVSDIHAIHGEEGMTGSCTVNSDPVLREKNARTHQNNFAYYRRKWGGINEREEFKTPFNNPALPIDYWRFEPALRARQQW